LFHKNLSLYYIKIKNSSEKPNSFHQRPASNGGLSGRIVTSKEVKTIEVNLMDLFQDKKQKKSSL